MQLRKMTLMIAALGLALTACPGGGREDLSCTVATEAIDCTGENEICHPTALVCVQTCTDTNDCPASSKTCEAISGSNQQKICKCATDEQCQTDERVADASTLSCDKSVGGNYGVCKSAGTGGGTTPPGAACTGEGQATCGYGQFCSSNVCKAVEAPTCANFDPAQGGKTPVFNASSSTGPIIYSVAQLSFGTGSFCGGSTTVSARVKAYTTGTLFPSKKSDLPGLFYVRVNGEDVDGTTLILDSGYSVQDGGKRAEFTMNFCPTASATQLTVGLYFTGGNETCAVFKR